MLVSQVSLSVVTTFGDAAKALDPSSWPLCTVFGCSDEDASGEPDLLFFVGEGGAKIALKNEATLVVIDTSSAVRS